MKIIYTAHGFHFYKGANFLNWLFFFPIEYLLSFVTDVGITMNKEDFKISKKFFSKNEKKIMLNGVGVNEKIYHPVTYLEKQSLRESFGFERDTVLIMYVAELSKRKNQQLLLKAFRKLDKNNSYKLLLVGKGKDDIFLKKLTRDLNLETKVEFLGYRNDVEKLLKCVDIVVSSSLQEGLPVNIIEAQFSKLPVVVTDCRGNRDLVENGINGFVVSLNKGNEKTFSEKVAILIENKDLRLEFGNECFKKNSKYSEKTILKDMMEIYKGLL